MCNLLVFQDFICIKSKFHSNLECHMYMAAYVDGFFLDKSKGARTWKLKRPSDGAIWYSPGEGIPLGASSNYLRVRSISCFGCEHIASVELNCGKFSSATTPTNIVASLCAFQFLTTKYGQKFF